MKYKLDETEFDVFLTYEISSSWLIWILPDSIGGWYFARKTWKKYKRYVAFLNEKHRQENKQHQ